MAKAFLEQAQPRKCRYCQSDNGVEYGKFEDILGG